MKTLWTLQRSCWFAYIETLQRQAAPPTAKQHMAAIRMLFSWLTEKGVLAMNPAREVKTEKFSRTEGKTPAFVEGEVQALLDAIDTFTHVGLRDRAVLGVLAYTFARIGAVVNLKVEDYYPSGKRFLLPLPRKGRQRKGAPRSSQARGAAARLGREATSGMAAMDRQEATASVPDHGLTWIAVRSFA
jgi:site-specific recombinase XerD